MGNYMVSDEINRRNNLSDICYGHPIYVGCACINPNYINPQIQRSRVNTARYFEQAAQFDHWPFCFQPC
ncbi:hypothetical protein BFI38_20545 (plasmid) [Yersinia pestis subsp. microtus bv. Caucasica]|nr:conserved hypothetical protein [Yersinia pestis Antiqua]ABP42362.1 conserved hypothetical protein [Yersinia pestis Pestoides F]ANW16544.1 hypothetical protein BAY22_21470 [Yersinia pestis]KJG82578.1 hypothetical protein RN23_20780 [Yersinia pestis subsp. microtus bv. Ulegeica]KKM47707.1 hypothetical protein KD37_22595 [Yersinia pestis subsp. pestis bv. Orientalis]KPD38739.1 hypothetical protein AC472_19990 [Yersinia pestis subsp. microtus bv. Caucasica]OML14571.1 hypothetical protein BFI41